MTQLLIISTSTTQTHSLNDHLLLRIIRYSAIAYSPCPTYFLIDL